MGGGGRFYPRLHDILATPDLREIQRGSLDPLEEQPRSTHEVHVGESRPAAARHVRRILAAAVDGYGFEVRAVGLRVRRHRASELECLDEGGELRCVC